MLFCLSVGSAIALLKEDRRNNTELQLFSDVLIANRMAQPTPATGPNHLSQANFNYPSCFPIGALKLRKIAIQFRVITSVIFHPGFGQGSFGLNVAFNHSLWLFVPGDINRGEFREEVEVRIG